MKITRAEVERVAHLARLKLTPAEAEEFTGQLGQILEYVERLQRLDTTGIEPTSHAVPMVNAFRADEVRPSLDRERALQNAPDREQAFFRVPKIIE